MTEPSLIILRGLEGNEPTEWGVLQTVLVPHLETLKFAWWCVFAGVLIVVVLRHIIFPLLSGHRTNK